MTPLNEIRLRMYSLILGLIMALVCLQAGARANAPANALVDAAESGDLSRVQTLLSNGINVDAKSVGPQYGVPEGITALFAASKEGHLDVVKALLDKGADVNAKVDRRKDSFYYNGTTALVAASGGDYKDVVELLLAKGADPNGRIEGQVTALVAAIPTLERNSYLLSSGYHHNCIEIMKLLLAKGANVNEKSQFDETALSKAASYGRIDIVKLLLDNGADVNEKSGINHDALESAINNGDVETVKLLIAKGADLSSKDIFLVTASRKGLPELVQLLIEKGADVNSLDHTGRSALIWATQYAFVNQYSPQALLGQGRPTLTEVVMDYKNGHNGKGHFEYVQDLALGGSSKQVDPIEANERHRKVVEALIAKGANVNAKSMDGCTPLMTANELGHTEIAAMLVKAGAKP